MSELAPQSTEPEAEADLSGRQLGDFRLLRRLGRGAMAEVYLAEQGSLRRQVAVKVLRSNLANDATYVKRFHNEAQAAASLVHANIVQIHDVGCVDGVHYIAQEYVQGQNLRELIVRRGPPDAPLAMRVMRQVAAALNKAAAAGIVHRDIKPENIMIARSGEVKVADFGLARLSGDAVNLTQVGITMGTPLYMSPEQVEGRPLDPRSDIYSLGVTCYHMLTGAPPFRGETALAVAVQHLKSLPDRLDNQRPDLPGGLCRIVHKMLAKEPAQRYQSSRELLRDLRAVQVASSGEDSWEDLESSGTHERGTDSTGLTGRIAATQRLDALMKTAALQSYRRPRWRWWVAAGMMAFVLGGLLAHAAREPAILDGGPALQVTRQGTAMQQLKTARFKRDTPEYEEWLLSVAKFYPDDTFWVWQSKQDLAQHFVSQEQYGQAKQLFDEFAREPDTEPERRVFGLAGQSLILALTDKPQLAADKLIELTTLRNNNKLEGNLNPYTIPMIRRATERVQKEIGAQRAAEWNQFLDNLSEQPS